MTSLFRPPVQKPWASFEDLLRRCYDRALLSPDPSTQNAAVLVEPLLLDGMEGGKPFVETYAHNMFAYGVEETPERWQSPLKYSYVEHAERGALYKAARYGISTEELFMVCPWAACCDCARAIIQSGVMALVTHKQACERPSRWGEEISRAYDMLAEAGVVVVQIDSDLQASKVRMNGELWQP